MSIEEFEKFLKKNDENDSARVAAREALLKFEEKVLKALKNPE